MLVSSNIIYIYIYKVYCIFCVSVWFIIVGTFMNNFSFHRRSINHGLNKSVIVQSIKFPMGWDALFYICVVYSKVKTVSKLTLFNLSTYIANRVMHVGIFNRTIYLLFSSLLRPWERTNICDRCSLIFLHRILSGEGTQWINEVRSKVFAWDII